MDTFDYIQDIFTCLFLLCIYEIQDHFDTSSFTLNDYKCSPLR